MKKWKKWVALFCVMGLLLGGCGAQRAKVVKLDPQNPVVISLWNYYSGAQQAAFNTMVEDFNQTVGMEEGIIVETTSIGGINDLANAVKDAANKKVGAADMPNIFGAYADTVYELDQQGTIANIAPYFSQEELDQYVPGYISEGEFAAGELKIFPIVKSTEVMMLNKTDWDKFAAATGAQLETLATMEGVTATAEQYYQWTDGQTVAPDDGQAFFGRDALANLFIIGSMQLGQELFAVKDGVMTLNYDESVMRRIWDNYYVPYVKGYFASNGRFRTDDVRTGKVIGFVGSTTGATFFPNERVVSDNESYPIDFYALTPPVFEGGEPYAVQQGAGMAVTVATAEEEYAAVVFLKWITQPEHSIQMSINSGYLPVMKEANDQEKLKDAMEQAGTDHKMQEILSAGIEVVNQNQLYTNKPFPNGFTARNMLEDNLTNKATADRQAVLQSIAGGMSWQEAVAQFDNDENFQSWYQSSKAELELALQ